MTYTSSLKQRMLKAGYPLCYKEKGKGRHCKSCIKLFKRLKNER